MNTTPQGKNLGGGASNSSSDSTKLNLEEVLKDIFLVLTNKEQEVITKRFSLDSQPRQTLERIGQHFSVTRERIRQIEKIALGKLRRTVHNTKLSVVNELAKDILEKKGGVMLEVELVSEVLKVIYSGTEIDPYVVKLSLNIDSEITKVDKTNIFKPFWRLNRIPFNMVKEATNNAVSTLTKKKEVSTVDVLVAAIKDSLDEKFETITSELIASSLNVDKRLKGVEEGFGLMTWRHINPKSIRDKAYIVLKKANKPLHFVEIANAITDSGFDKKMVTVQAVHNELIRYEQFVLVGRGLYALKEWGYKEGTVADIIESLLKKKSPMTKQEIIQGVLKQRYVKKGTISLNLQKNPHFERVGRAVYAYKK